ncbi:MAG: peptidylprolyl isomerase [Candidatus Caenarcaniphilales bacterium]|jgi:peptidylprolyl isomerase|nr:peptidylprolyl isomerase [Candidatus Caenarcaniphilales bacterium]
MKYLKLLLVSMLAVSIAACSQKPKINQGSIVRVDYKGTLADGSVFDTTEGKEPLAFMVGANQVLPAFEKQIVTLSQGQSKKFTIKAKEAYGQPDPNKIVTLPKDGRFKDVELKEGSIIFANNKGPNGRVVQTPMKVVKINDKEVTLDYNHPLSGKDLTFEAKLVEVKEPQVAPPAAAPQAAPQPAMPEAQPAPEAAPQG